MAKSRNWEEVYTAQSQAIERLTRERDHLRTRLALAREEVLELVGAKVDDLLNMMEVPIPKRERVEQMIREMAAQPEEAGE